jgi:hypothetical protein
MPLKFFALRSCVYKLREARVSLGYETADPQRLFWNATGCQLPGAAARAEMKQLTQTLGLTPK